MVWQMYWPSWWQLWPHKDKIYDDYYKIYQCVLFWSLPSKMVVIKMKNFRRDMKWKKARRIAFQGQKSINFSAILGS